MRAFRAESTSRSRPSLSTDTRVRRVVSVSLGTSKRDKTAEIEILGEKFELSRRGTDGDMRKFRALVEELDGTVDAIGVGGADIYVVIEDRRYAFREIVALVSGVTETPVVDGSGLKHTLERATLERLEEDGIIHFKDEVTLLVSAVDRFGMAQALDKAGGKVMFGDILFGVGVPILLRSYRSVVSFGRVLLPLVTQLPFKWFYPTGEKQEQRTPKFPKVWAEATVIAGDTLFIRRYAPDDLTGKTVITQTIRSADIEWLKKAGVRRVITTTPVIGGETFATNVMEGVVVALLGKPPAQISDQEYLDVLARLDWRPNVMELNPPAASGTISSNG